MKKSFDRRIFFKGCLSAASIVLSNPALLARANNRIKLYSRVKLVDQNEQPVTSEMLESKQCYIFNYPFVSTPCFLINTGQSLQKSEALLTKNGDVYDWQGGSGPDNTVVAFAAICSHKLSYPTRTISFINYRADQILQTDDDHTGTTTAQVIFCCSERSAYDPLKGASVLSGPAPAPLTTIAIEYDAGNDHYYAVGTQGTEHYEEFFERFSFNLALENQFIDIAEKVEGTARIYNSHEYSKHLQSC